MASSYPEGRIAKLPRRVEAFDAAAIRIYSMHIRFCWSEAKRAANPRVHGLDFAAAEQVFAGFTFTFETTDLATTSNAS
jgi:hypothetical protein